MKAKSQKQRCLALWHKNNCKLSSSIDNNSQESKGAPFLVPKLQGSAICLGLLGFQLFIRLDISICRLLNNVEKYTFIHKCFVLCYEHKSYQHFSYTYNFVNRCMH